MVFKLSKIWSGLFIPSPDPGFWFLPIPDVWVKKALDPGSATLDITQSARLTTKIIFVLGSVPDPWHFGVDPDPRIHASDLWIRIRILLFSSLTFKMPANTNFLTQFFLLVTFWRSSVHLHYFSKKKVKKSHKIVEFKVFLIIFAWW